MIDVNVYLSRWPCRRLQYDETPKLVERLRRAKIEQAWAGSFDALLHRDLAGVNARLAEECQRRGDGLLVPFGAVNPMLPDWQEDVRRCREEHRMPGIRLHPNYHGYKLDDPVFAELLRLADQHGLIVQIALKMEDERTQHPLLQVPPVDPKPLLDLLPALPKLRIVLLNAMSVATGELPARLAQAGQVYFEIAMLEKVGGIGALLKQMPFERLLFGSYLPFFILESALLKLRESELGEFAQTAITDGNARKLVSGQ